MTVKCRTHWNHLIFGGGEWSGKVLICNGEDTANGMQRIGREMVLWLVLLRLLGWRIVVIVIVIVGIGCNVDGDGAQ
jgi:hypothetical protein